MRLALSFAALFLSVILLQLSSGSMGPLDALSGRASGFSPAQIGLLGSAHFTGFFIGCLIAPLIMGYAGHIRAFSAFAAMGAISAISHPLWVEAEFWFALRIMTGLSISGCYTVIEAWLQAKSDNGNRGRTMGIYRFLDLSASLAAQLMIGVLEPGSYVSYNLLAIFCCLALLPLLLTTSRAPEAPKAPKLRPLAAMRLSPLAAAGVMTAGVTMPAFRMVGPVYGQEVGLRADEIGFFLALGILGGALAQFPAGWIADKFDRRHVLIGFSLLSIVVCLSMGLSAAPTRAFVFCAIFMFGVATLPVFSISAALANDFAKQDGFVEVSASLMFIYGIGAIASPLVAAILIDISGPGAMFAMIAVAHGGLVLFGLFRLTVREGVAKARPYTYMPRTSFLLGRFMRRKR